MAILRLCVPPYIGPTQASRYLCGGGSSIQIEGQVSVRLIWITSVLCAKVVSMASSTGKQEIQALRRHLQKPEIFH